MNFENIVIFLPNDNRVLNFVPNVIKLYTFIKENLQIVRRSPLKVIWSNGNAGSSPYSKNKWKVFLKLLNYEMSMFGRVI